MPRHKTTIDIIHEVFGDMNEYDRAGNHLYEPDIFDDTPEIIEQARTAHNSARDETEGA